MFFVHGYESLARSLKRAECVLTASSNTQVTVTAVSTQLGLTPALRQIERYDYFFSQFAERGISVLAFDQRGFGKTGQKTGSLGATTGAKQLADIEYFLSKEEKRLQGQNIKTFLYGHSMVRECSPSDTDEARPGRS